ncbi:tetraacyldisaccharide 4'-kinase [Aurantimonas sp. MSK8Z-1]|nr:tetraacyldisaccharide 4'-kinase [Aurantimonas sp. MSK8Z-1]MCW4115299.1 tetraacyldisaccharide 4'-kinase [Aurantimonas sp. MSK8Z-1]
MMQAETPPFWWRPRGWQARLLSPAAAAYARAARWRLDHGERAALDLPVLCVGNFTVGGGGKTPTALAIGAAAQAMGHRPGFLSRGYGRASGGALLVDPAHHTAATVGDEPLLLAALAPTAVAVDRKRGAALLREAGCDLVIMDDGFQSARLAIDYALIVIDAGRGLGNGAVLPAGPLRAAVGDQIRHADALLVVGKGAAGDTAIRLTARAGKPVFEADLLPRAPERLAGRRVLAFAGIADPDKFYRSLRCLGATVVATRDFPDHHVFSDEVLEELAAESERDGLQLVTTRKDAVRLEGGGAAARAFLASVEVLEVELRFSPDSLGARFVRDAFAGYRRRVFG